MKPLFSVQYTLKNIDIDGLNSELGKLPCGAPVVIYGAGNLGRAVYAYLKRNGIDAGCFCDTDFGKQKKSLFGLKVISPEALFEKHKGDTVLVSPIDAQTEIFEYITSNGIPEENIICLSFIESTGSILIPGDMAPRETVGLVSAVSANAPAAYRKGSPGKAPIVMNTVVYNIQESYLRRAIESALNQTFRNFRYLIIDNGSSDGSKEIINEYAKLDNRIEVLTRKKNITGFDWEKDGAAIYQQEFYSRLTTKYFCKLDSDDYLHPMFLERVYGLAAEYDADIVACQWMSYNENNPQIHGPNNIGAIQKGYYGANTVMDAFMGNIHLWRPVWGKLMKTPVYLGQKGAAPRDLGNISDVYRMFSRVLASTSVYVTDDVLYYHTVRSASTALNLTRNSAAVTRIYYLYEWLCQKLFESGAATEFNIWTVNDFAFSHIEDPDMAILAKAAEAEPQLAADVIRAIMEANPPAGLLHDRRMPAVLETLRAMLEKADQNIGKLG